MYDSHYRKVGGFVFDSTGYRRYCYHMGSFVTETVLGVVMVLNCGGACVSKPRRTLIRVWVGEGEGEIFQGLCSHHLW